MPAKVKGPTDHVVVVGAGLAGLSAALRLAGAGRKVTVVERESVPGGRNGLLKNRSVLSRKIEEFFDDLGDAIFHMWLCHIFSVNLRIWMSICNCIRTSAPLQH